MGLAYVSPRIKTLVTSYGNKHFVTPTLGNAADKTYPIMRPFYYYYNKEGSDQTAPLLQFILSPTGQEIVKKNGYISVNE